MAFTRAIRSPSRSRLSNISLTGAVGSRGWPKMGSRLKASELMLGTHVAGISRRRYTRPTYPEIAPAVRVAATAAEQTLSPRREAYYPTERKAEIQKAADVKSAKDKTAAARDILHEPQSSTRARVNVRVLANDLISRLDCLF